MYIEMYGKNNIGISYMKFKNNLYDEEFNSESKSKKMSENDDLAKQFYREFDYGIDATDGILYFTQDIMEGSSGDFIARTRLIRRLNPDIKSITILMNSPGGSVIEALAIIDFIHSLKDEIKFNVVVRGSAMSAAALIMMCCTGTRVVGKHSKIMVHQISTSVAGKAGDVRANAKFLEDLEKECNSLMESHSNKDAKYWKDVQRDDNFIPVSDAIELGIIDKIL